MDRARQHGYCYEINGWNYVSVWGSPKERGFSQGFFCANDFKKLQETMNFYILETTGRTWDYFIDIEKREFKDSIKKNFPEFFEEMEGMAEGCIAAGVETTVDEIMAMNDSITLINCWYPKYNTEAVGSSASKEGGSPDRCSAFIANGDYTTDGKIVVAHNSFTDFLDGQFYRVILDVKPDKGHRMLMQTRACSIWSGTDVFVTDTGIIGTETTIGGFSVYEKKDTIGCRIRQAMQYGDTMEDYVKILLKNNSGDYANAWLFGDTRTNEIMRFELGLNYWDVQTTKNGYFYGANFPFSPTIRNLECSNTGYQDIRRHQGARQVRLPDLVEQYKGKINIEIAKRIIGDHYDVYLQRENPCSRCVCSHYELDGREYMSDPSRPKPYSPHGAVDGFVADANTIKKMGIIMKFGSSCNIPFYAKEFCDRHRQWKNLEPYLWDRPAQPWTLFTPGMRQNKRKQSTRRVSKTAYGKNRTRRR